MPRLMSFALTKEQIRNRTKDVTRRLGWSNLKPGEIFIAVEKCRGLKKGEQVKRLATLRCVSNDPEILWTISRADVMREGFPELTRGEFVTMFTKHMKVDPEQVVNRIEFEIIELL